MPTPRPVLELFFLCSLCSFLVLFFYYWYGTNSFLMCFWRIIIFDVPLTGICVCVCVCVFSGTFLTIQSLSILILHVIWLVAVRAVACHVSTSRLVGDFLLL